MTIDVLLSGCGIGEGAKEYMIFTMELSKIQPSQLYISEAKLQSAKTYLEQMELLSMNPLPVKRIGETIFFTDGHTRALALWEKGVREISVCLDEDDLNWMQYLICLKWCSDLEIRSVADLMNRVVDHTSYERLWNDRCRVMQNYVKQGLYEGLSLRNVEDKVEKGRICDSVLRSLPEWFGIEEAILEYVQGVANTLFLVAQIGSIPVGFLSIQDHNAYTSEIYVMGIFEEVHGRGLGRMLLKAAEDFLYMTNKKFLMVKTLGDSRPNQAYRKTKLFYKAMGFFPLEESTAIWGSENPCLIMIKPLFSA